MGGETTDDGQNATFTSSESREQEANPSSLLKERHPDWPEIDLHFYFGAHGDLADFDELPDLLDGAAIYMYENFSGPIDSMMLNLAAQRPPALSPHEIDEFIDYAIKTYKPAAYAGTHQVLEARIRAVYGTGVVVGHLDVDPAKDGQIDYDIASAIVAEWYRGGTIDEVLQDRCAYDRRFYDANARREAIILDGSDKGHPTAGRLEEELERIFTDHPELKKLPRIKIVDTIGAAHARGLLARAKGKVATVTATYAPDAGFGDFGTWASFAEGKQPSRDSLAREIIYGVMGNTLRDLGLNSWPTVTSRETRLYLTVVTNQLDADDLVTFFAADNTRKTSDIINSVLVSKSLRPLATSPDELRATLQELLPSGRLDSSASV